jgi:benzylsuccinate CoA-transferase BbsF subunit
MKQQALAGVKVLDFGWVMAGPWLGKQLADHGAQVVRVESTKRPDTMRASRHVAVSTAANPDDKPTFTHLNTSKYGITINLRHPRAQEMVERLIKWADIVTENFTPGTIGKLGLSYERIRQIKPDIIMVGCSVYGQTGPLAQQWGMDGTGNALSGRTYLTGWPDRSPTTPMCIPYGDAILPLFAAAAVIAALDYKRRTGKGQYIDASMLEVCTRQISPAIFDWKANSHLQTRMGNRVPDAAPHGVYPCTGDDRWCAITVFSDEEWAAFCKALGDPSWTAEQEFASLSMRKQNEDKLDNLVAGWTKNHTAEDVMQILQAAGVPAGIVQNAQDLMDKDPQLKERECFVKLKHPVLGIFNHPSPPYKLLKTKAEVKTSPCLGEHNEYVCTRLLGMSDEEFIDLMEAGVFE